MIEDRIPNSNLIMADTIIGNFNSNNLLHDNNHIKEQIPYYIEVFENELSNSLSSHYSSIPSCMKNNRSEQHLDDRSYGFNHNALGNDAIIRSLSPLEIAQYFESLNTDIVNEEYSSTSGLVTHNDEFESFNDDNIIDNMDDFDFEYILVD